MVLAKEKCGRYDSFPVVLQISNHGRVFSDGIALVSRGGGGDGGGSLPRGESNFQGFELTEEHDATLNLIPFPFC